MLKMLKTVPAIILSVALVLLAAFSISKLSIVKKQPERAQQKQAAAAKIKRGGEKITYSISPLKGSAQYKDLGVVDLNGRPALLVVFETHVGGFADVEKIYSDPNTYLAIRVERDVSGWFGKEHIIEEYDQAAFTGKITKFKNNKKTEETIIKADGPIYNAIILPFYQRNSAPFNKGWSRSFRIPKKVDIKLAGIEQLTLNGRVYTAYRFSGTPGQFDFWISNENPYVPLKIKGGGVFKYTMLLKEYASTNPQ